eukprot:3956969-Alexandrium_andersonii.AAC.1
MCIRDRSWACCGTCGCRGRSSRYCPERRPCRGCRAPSAAVPRAGDRKPAVASSPSATKALLAGVAAVAVCAAAGAVPPAVSDALAAAGTAL